MSERWPWSRAVARLVRATNPLDLALSRELRTLRAAANNLDLMVVSGDAGLRNLRRCPRLAWRNP
jgi:hypothetical protein